MADQPDDNRRRSALHRLEILDGLETAFERREEMLAIVSSSPDADEAKVRLMSSFGLSDVQAVAVLDLQVRRFGETERRRISDERAGMRAEYGID